MTGGRLSAVAIGALAALSACSVPQPMSDKLEIVPLVRELEAPCRVLLQALVDGDLAAVEPAVGAEFRCTAVPGLRGPPAARAMVARHRARFRGLVGGHFKVRRLLERGETAVRARCERRVRGTLIDGRRFEETAEIELTFVRERDAWRIAACVPGPATEVVAREPLYEEWTRASGVIHTFHVRGALGPGFYPGEHDGGAVSAVDVDADGDVDLLLTEGDGPRLWLNDGSGRFTDATAASGLTPLPAGEARGLCCADFDGDGHRDLFVAVHSGPNVFWRGGPGATFRDATAASGLAASGRFSTSVAAGDLDGDGDLELYVCNYGQLRERAVDWFARNGEPNTCWRNDGGGRFTEVAAAWGVDDTGYSLAVGLADADGDGDLDCYVADDFAYNRFYRNRGDGRFDEVTEAATGPDDLGTSMGVTWADLDGDADLDCYVSNMYSNVGQWIFDDPDYPVPGIAGFLFRGRVLNAFRKMSAGNTLLRNDGDRFAMLVSETGAANAGWAWSAPALDADGDGRTDLFVANGMITGEDPTDT